MADIIAIYQEETNSVKDAVDLVSSCIFQPIGTNLAPHFARNGGNALGIDLTKGPLMRMYSTFPLYALLPPPPICLSSRYPLTDMPPTVLNLAVSWSNEADDTRILAAMRNIVNRSDTAANAAGLGNAYLYQNYAAAEQNVFGSYGAKNLAKLKAVSKKYDPTGVWQKLQPGYFKLP